MFKSTLIHLTEPFDNTELYLIGTMNSSDILANRTKKLISEIKPDVVFAQTDENWWKAAQLLGHVKSQDEMDLTKKDMENIFNNKFVSNPHTIWHKMRWGFFGVLARLIYGLPFDYNPVLPGLETKYALEEATKLNSKIVYLGYELDKTAQQRIYHETRYTLIKSIWNYNKFFNRESYRNELLEFKLQKDNYGLRMFIESNCDQYFINW
jgi:hypothetical protein